jgi:hypothetical protein
MMPGPDYRILKSGYLCHLKWQWHDKGRNLKPPSASNSGAWHSFQGDKLSPWPGSGGDLDPVDLADNIT